MKIKGKYSESAVLYAIILSAAAVLSIIVFFVVYALSGSSSSDKPAEQTSSASGQSSVTEAPESDDSYKVADEIATEMQDAAIDLIKDNYTVLRLYYTKGMNHKEEPYGNSPEDGYYSVESDKYSSLSQLEEIVDRTYTADFAETVTRPVTTAISA